jgi:hypothetical protein
MGIKERKKSDEDEVFEEEEINEDIIWYLI